jgi:hypothetical protein
VEDFLTRITRFLGIALLAYASLGQAALGGRPEPFDANDGQAVSSVSTTASNYVRRETTLASGTVVREYISATGIVFAVAWSGPFLPNLKSLLGQHFETMVAEAARLPKAGRSSVVIEHPEVVIHSGGRMRAFEGNAWIPAALPAGFAADQVR